MQYIKAYKSRSGSGSPGTVTTFDIQIPLVDICTLQLVHAPTSPEVEKTGAAKKPSQSGGPYITVIQLLVRGLHFRGQSSSGLDRASQNDLSGAFTSLSAALLSKAESRGSYRHDLNKQCYVEVGSSFASAIRRDVAVSLGVVSSSIKHSAPDHLLATSVVLAKTLLSIVSAQKQPRASSSVSDRQLVHGILILSHQRTAIDPLSTIQPSFLIQHGLPDKLRKDMAFKFLVYLRNCLRLIDDHERQTIRTIQPDVSVSDIIDVLQTQWYSPAGDDDSSSLSQHALLQELLRGRREMDSPAKEAFWESPYDSITLSLAGTRLSLRHPAESVESNFISGPINVALHQQPGDLVQPITWIPGKVHPNSSTRDRHPMLRVSLALSLDHISSTVHPQLVEFTQIALRDYRQHSIALQSVLKNTGVFNSNPTPPRSSPSPSAPIRQPPSLAVDCTLTMRSFTFTAAAEQLIVRFKNADVAYASSLWVNFHLQEHSAWDISTNHSLTFHHVAFEACSAANAASPKPHVLASLTFGDGRTNVVLQQDIHRNLVVRVLVGLGRVHLDVPRSVLRLYRFVEGWRADYLPGIEATVRALLAELGSSPNGPSRSPSQSSHSPKLLTFQVQASVTSIRATLQVMHGTWMSWELRETIAFLLNDSRRKDAYVFGLQMGPHAFEISGFRSGSQLAQSSGIRLELPTITLRGKYDGSGLQGMALVEFFHVTLRPSDWDTLLSVQQKSGQDFTDLIHIIEQTRQKGPFIPSAAPSDPLSADKANKKPFKFNGSFKMKGFRVGLEGITSTLFLECDDISGGVGNLGRSLWHVRLSDLALSLASQGSIGARSHRDRRSAFVRVDIEVGMGKKTNSGVQHLQVSVNKIHAVMQPSSIGELGDFVDHLQVGLGTSTKFPYSDCT